MNVGSACYFCIWDLYDTLVYVILNPIRNLVFTRSGFQTKSGMTI